MARFSSAASELAQVWQGYFASSFRKRPRFKIRKFPEERWLGVFKAHTSEKRKGKLKKTDAPAIVLLLAHPFMCTYRFLREKTMAVSQNYDVFLSYRGPDTSTGFTDFLYNSLVAAGFHVFRDDNAVPVSDEIGLEVLRAIRSCRIAIPIISEQYVQSKLCLRELAEMMECRRKHGKSVFPVFYKVDVVDVGCQRGKIEQALFEHERQCSSEEVRAWRKELASVARIGGWTSQTIADGREAELVEMVRDKVSYKLKSMWIERLPMFIRSEYFCFSEKKRRDSKCQVFLAFRGSDTRYDLAAYLYISLVAVGIRVFKDDDPCLIGKDVDHEIRNAIEHCKISIPILSENYASSHWCLDDLAQMVECKRRKGQKILPIFYKVKPSHVKDVSHLFGEHMLQHKELVDKGTYERLERALREVGSYKGWVADGHEEVLVKQVVEEVSKLLKNPLDLISIH
ncbi:uncharacterized protein LOC115664955 [Syzygium oleosum]|uniref:uncharacterized protein LOC115664955 n=1 Tax=Syzygium oleosum TaxID=219896 RepID=UPI0024B89356|nr:uncharacterized protein LOC115664955 [Syzygium oleosum]